MKIRQDNTIKKFYLNYLHDFRGIYVFIIIFILLSALLTINIIYKGEDKIFINVILERNTTSVFTKDMFGKRIYFSPPGYCMSAKCLEGAMKGKLDVRVDTENYEDDSNYWNVGILSKDERTLTIESYSNARIRWISENDNKFDDSIFKIISVEKFAVSRTPKLEIVNLTLESGDYYE